MNRHVVVYRTVSRQDGVLHAERVTDVNICDNDLDLDDLAFLYEGDFAVDDTYSLCER
jgi:hypothetical protein